MKKLPVLKYNDLRDLMCLNITRHLNGVVIDDASLEVMLRIEKTMQRLKVMGSDARRILWIEIKAPGKRNREEFADANDNYWYQVCSAHYKDFHYMLICNAEGRLISLQNRESIKGKRIPDAWYGDVSKPLMKIERYIIKLVDCICENPDEYNNYVEDHLPYSKREGKIKRSILNRICPEYCTFDDPQHVVDVIKKYEALSMTTFEKMTLRTYIHVWRIAYVAYQTKDRYRPMPMSDFEGLSDMEIFISYNPKGHKIEEMDLDSEEDYLKWKRENSVYHCMEVAYARIFLYPVKEEGHWCLSLDYSIYGYTQDVFNILESLWQEGIRVKCSHAMTRILRYAQETDYVGIAQISNPRAYNDVIGNQIKLPNDEENSAQQVVEIISAAKWKKQIKVRPRRKEEISAVACVNLDEHFCPKFVNLDEHF